jgi:hypothetical protein
MINILGNNSVYVDHGLLRCEKASGKNFKEWQPPGMCHPLLQAELLSVISFYFLMF